MHIMHIIRYYAEPSLLRNIHRITHNILIYAKKLILRNNLLGRLKQDALPFQFLAAGAGAPARDLFLGWLWNFKLSSKLIVHLRYESFPCVFAPTDLFRRVHGRSSSGWMAQ